MSKIPFIWSNNIISKNKFICEIYNKKKVLSFSEYKTNILKINDNKYIYISNYQKNSLTGTRCITFEETEKLLKEKKNKNTFESIILQRHNLKSLNIKSPI